MKRFLGKLLVIIFFSACGENRPKGIFPEKKMTDVLFDIHLAQGYISTSPMDTLNNKKVNYYLSIYQKYNTDSVGVRKNLEYYAAHPQDLQDIYAEVSKRLQSTESDLSKRIAEKQAEIFKLDSVKRQRNTDSLKLVKRDSLIHFYGRRDLFLHLPDSLKKSLKDSVTNNDSLSNSIIKDAVRNSILNEQKKWEMTFYYFNENRPAPVIPPSSSTDTQNPI
jgi:hypothetical protein